MPFKQISGKVYGQKHTEETFSYPYKNVRRIICTCGYEGICIQETCKKCRKKTTVQVNEKIPKTHTPVYSELTGLTKSSDWIKATLLVRTVFQHVRHHYLLETSKVLVEFNIRTGETFANNENITYRREEKQSEASPFILQEVRQGDIHPYYNGRFVNVGHRGAFEYTLPFFQNGCENRTKRESTNPQEATRTYSNLKEHQEFLRDFFTRCAKERNLRYTDVPHLLREKDGFEQLIALLRLPVLEYAAELNINVLSKEIATQLDSAKNGKDVWKILIGHTGKDVKKHALTDVNHLNHLMRWGPFIQKQKNLVKLAASFRFEEHHYKIISLEGWEHPQIKLFDTMDEKQAKFRAGMRLIQSTHDDETVWVNRVLQFKNNPSDAPKEEEEVYRYICDIGDMHTQILNEFPDFTLKRKHSIKAIHNELVASFRKIKVPNVILPFTEKMKTFEEDGFVFATSSHELVDVGVEMDICVGAYWSRVYNGNCSIVLLKEKNEPKVCIELDPHFAIVQAKMHKNKRPSKDYQEKINTWAAKHQLALSTQDLNPPLHTLFNFA